MIEEEKKSGSTAIVIGIVVLLLCICAIVLGVGGYALFAVGQSIPSTDSPTSTHNGTPVPESEVTRPPVDSISTDTLETLNAAVVPENDPYDLACRLLELCS